MPSPGGNYHPARQTPASSSFLLAAGAVAGDGQAATGGCGGSTLTPGRAGWPRGHGSGVPPDAQRPPPGEGATAPATSAIRSSVPWPLAGVQPGRPSRNGSTAASFSATPQTSVVCPSP